MTHADPASPSARLVSDGVAAYLGWGWARTPAIDTEAVTALAQRHGVDPVRLEMAVTAIVDFAEAIELMSPDLDSDDATEEYERAVLAAHPELDSAAVDALTNMWFHQQQWRWLPRGEYPKYWTISTWRSGERLPIALYRRSVVDGRIVDESLANVDEWRRDTAAHIDDAVNFPLSSDLEPVTAGRAASIVGTLPQILHRLERSTRPPAQGGDSS